MAMHNMEHLVTKFVIQPMLYINWYNGKGWLGVEKTRWRVFVLWSHLYVERKTRIYIPISVGNDAVEIRVANTKNWARTLLLRGSPNHQVGLGD